jgi:protein-disulfide isomerase/rhodanese-related sulfurtransferase
MTTSPPQVETPPASPPRAPTVTRSLALAVAIMVAVVAGLGGYLLGATSGDAAAATDDPAVAAAPASATMAPSSLGDPDAPVTMTLWSDFQCPFCQRHATETQAELIRRYVDSGQLRIEWRDFPALGQASMLLAIAGRAAEQQGAFWTFHDAVFASPTKVSEMSQIVVLAESAGLDVARFQADLQDPLLELAVRRDLADGQARGVTGTPAFLVNGRAVRGAQPLQTFVDLIDSELSGEVPAAPVTLAPTEAAALLADPPAGLQILDVRTAEEVAEGTIVPVAQLINLDFYADTFAQDLQGLDPSRPVLVYCRTGNRSGQTAAYLASQGFDVFDVDGGIEAWQAVGLSVQ